MIVLYGGPFDGKLIEVDDTVQCVLIPLFNDPNHVPSDEEIAAGAFTTKPATAVSYIRPLRPRFGHATYDGVSGHFVLFDYYGTETV